jgi:hypothetical protein
VLLHDSLVEEEAGLPGGKGALWRLLKRLYRLRNVARFVGDVVFGECVT